MKEKENLISKRLDLLSGKTEIEYKSDLGLIAGNLYLTISSRIDKYMLLIPEYKFLPLKKFDEKKANLNSQAQERFSAFVKRKLVGLSEYADFIITDEEYIVAVWKNYENNIEEFYKTIDEILCILEPKIVEVVEYQPEIEKINSFEEIAINKTIKIKIRSLTSSQKEELQAKIVKWIERFLDNGMGTQEKAYKELAKISITELGYELSKGQIEGQHKRHKDEFPPQKNNS